MYERSAIVLEKYFNNILKFNKENNLKINYNNYAQVVEEMEKYQKIIVDENEIIEKFDEIAKEIQTIQNSQDKLSKSNIKQEEKRNQLFNEFGEKPENIETKLKKIEDTVSNNNETMEELREDYIKALKIFLERQNERNKCAKLRRVAESNHRLYIENTKKIMEKIDPQDISEIKSFIVSEKDNVEKELYDIMIKNGKNEKIGFNSDVIKKAVHIRTDIAQREAEFYISIYEKTKKILGEIDNENLKLARYKKLLRDVSVKLEFLNAEKEYIVGFLDNERMTSMNTQKVHKKMMKEACENFDLDINQINNLYELIIRETTSKSTKKAYKELYNKTYLRDIEEKEKNFEQEANNVKLNLGTVINSNYWRIEGIKNIYNVFQAEVSQKFDKDLSDYRIDEYNEEIIDTEDGKDEDIEEKIDNYIDNYNEINKYEDTKEIEEVEENTDKYKEYDDNDEQYVEELLDEVYRQEENEGEPQARKNTKNTNRKANNKNSKEKRKSRNKTKNGDYEELEYPIENDKVDMIIQNTRKAQIRELKKKQKKSLFGKLFKED